MGLSSGEEKINWVGFIEFGFILGVKDKKEGNVKLVILSVI